MAGPGFGVHQRCGLVYVHGGDPQKAGAARRELLGVSGLTARTLRHSHASVALQNGHNIVAVSKCLGHARVSVTSDIYAHVLPAWQWDVADGFAAVMRE